MPCLEMLLFPHLPVICSAEKEKGWKKKKNRGKQKEDGNKEQK